MVTASRGRESLAFVFTDIEGSTRRWEQFPDAMADVVARHDRLLDQVVADAGGVLVNHTGDGLIASFSETHDAVDAALAVQAMMSVEDWSAVDGLAIRVAVHHGAIVRRDGEPFGWALNFASRLNSIAHGGQVVISEAALNSIGEDGLGSLTFRSLGEHRLRDIAKPAQVFQIDTPGAAAVFPPLRNSTRVRPLPTSIKKVVGREADVARVGAAARSHRAITIVGPKGVGTSTVALEVARGLAPDFDDNVHRCDLLGVSAGVVLESIATALAVSLRPGQSVDQSIAAWVDEQRMLIVIDHCARSVEPVARLVEVLLQTTQRCTVICTSTSPLGIEGEFLHRLLPLSQVAAVELFRERAAAVGATVTDSDELRILCDRLDGMPLALEVAAANAAVATIPELLSMLADHELRDAPNSDLSMRPMLDALAIGLDGVDPEHLGMLRASTVFAGPFDRTAFRRVCCEAVSEVEANRALTTFLDRSLMTVDDTSGQPLFRCFESVADVVRSGADQDEMDQAADRFVKTMIDFAEVSAAELRGPGELLAGRRIEVQLRNLRAAFDRALGNADLRAASGISTPLWDFGFMRMSDEYFRWSERLLDTFARSDESLLGPVFGVAALGAWVRDDLGSALEWSSRALRMEAEYGLAFDLPARLALINATVYSGTASAPPDVFQSCADYQRKRPERYFHVNVETQNSIMATWTGNPEAAVRRGVRAVRLARESENPSSLSFALWGLGSALEPEDSMQAISLLGEALELARSVGNKWLVAISQMSLASGQRRYETPLDAAVILLDLIDVLWRAGHRSHLWATLRLAALTLADLGDDETAIRLHRSVSEAKLTMPAVPADARDWENLSPDIEAVRGTPWIEHAVLITSTWTTKSCVDAARDALRAQVNEF